MRKNMTNVIKAFQAGKSHNEKTCSTDGETVWSYALKIARSDASGRVFILNPSRSPSNTTSSQIKALRVSFPEAELVDVL